VPLRKFRIRKEVCILVKKQKAILRGDVYYADLGSTIGCEQNGMRPILVLQNNIGNRYSPTIIVAAITSSQKKPLPTHVKIQGVHNLNQKSLVLLEQIRTIDRSRLREWIGNLDNECLSQVDEALKVSLGLYSSYLNFTEGVQSK
jgi:mRNA interferase MazF